MSDQMTLLYILADLAYIAKLSPNKKNSDFAITDFHQINGEFMDENILLANNLDKLFSKLEPDSYNLVLPDFLFTNTIVNVEVSSEDEVKAYLKDKLLPSLSINTSEYYVDTTILSNYKGAFRVQLTALEKNVVAALAVLGKSYPKIKIVSIAPLSWTTKSIISLEPSVAILQMGASLFLSQHYIGVDQCYSVPTAEALNFAETVKTLKGAEPSLQTVYLLSNSLVDDQIKEELKKTLPVQQLADLASENEQMPSYVKQIIEAGAKTFSIKEFLLPQFTLDADYVATPAVIESDDEEEAGEDEDTKEDVKKEVVAKKDEQPVAAIESALPLPAAPAVLATAVEPVALPVVKKIDLLSEVKPAAVISAKVEPAPKTVVEPALAPASKPAPTAVESKEIDFSQFANLAIDPSVFSKNTASVSTIAPKGDSPMSEPNKQVIQNKDDSSGVAKMIFIGFVSFVLTIALGVGLGLAWLTWTNQDKGSDKPNIEVATEVTPTPTAEITPTPTAVLDKTTQQILVVNATKKAGYAGQIAKLVEDSEFPKVSTANAKGIYDEGVYLLVKEDNATSQSLLSAIKTATKLEVVLKVDKSAEDSQDKYSAVLVLAK